MKTWRGKEHRKGEGKRDGEKEEREGSGCSASQVPLQADLSYLFCQFANGAAPSVAIIECC